VFEALVFNVPERVHAVGLFNRGVVCESHGSSGGLVQGSSEGFHLERRADVEHADIALVRHGWRRSSARRMETTNRYVSCRVETSISQALQ
jgi:hypothetical protein